MPNHSSLHTYSTGTTGYPGGAPYCSARPGHGRQARQKPHIFYMLESQALLLSCLSDPLHCRPPIHQSKLQWDEEASLVAFNSWDWAQRMKLIFRCVSICSTYHVSRSVGQLVNESFCNRHLQIWRNANHWGLTYAYSKLCELIFQHNNWSRNESVFNLRQGMQPWQWPGEFLC